MYYKNQTGSRDSEGAAEIKRQQHLDEINLATSNTTKPIGVSESERLRRMQKHLEGINQDTCNAGHKKPNAEPPKKVEPDKNKKENEGSASFNNDAFIYEMFGTKTERPTFKREPWQVTTLSPKAEQELLDSIRAHEINAEVKRNNPCANSASEKDSKPKKKINRGSPSTGPIDYYPSAHIQDPPWIPPMEVKPVEPPKVPDPPKPPPNNPYGLP
jgi:hypothetical protein